MVVSVCLILFPPMESDPRRRLLLLLVLCVSTALGVNFKLCLVGLQKANHSIGGTDNHGRPVPIEEASAITYPLCTKECGSGPETFQWSVFSQEFSSWLLPWLALISQLPYGSDDRLDNLTSMLLTVGSPTLAAYSLALTVLNGRWIRRRFSSYTFPNTGDAVRILSSLQQSPLQISPQTHLLSSLIVLPCNDKWWRELVVWLDHTHSWSISAGASIGWVVIAYIFTVIDSFISDITTSVNANGQGVGSLWLWLLPLVIGWLQISPKCNSKRLKNAMKRANDEAYVAMDTGPPVHANSLSQTERAITLRQEVEDPLYHDENCTVPIYNYARILPWVQAVEDVSDMFRAASEHANSHRPVNSDTPWEKSEEGQENIIHSRNRHGTRSQIEEYCVLQREVPHRRTAWGPDVFSRIIMASFIALSLQWGTTGAATVVVWFTPATGLGCRSGAYLLYGAMSTLIWMILLASSFLTHYVTIAQRASSETAVSSKISASSKVTFARWAAITLRRLGKILAVLNAVWIVVACLFQFGNFFDRCWCNGSVLGRGANAYVVIHLAPEDVTSMRGAWIGGVVLAASSAALCVLFVNLFIESPVPEI